MEIVRLIFTWIKKKLRMKKQPTIEAVNSVVIIYICKD